MTDKQIIIDGCDVSGCEHSYISTSLFEEKPYVKCCAFFLENEDSYCDCKDNPNCYYKQLKRKEQECEELKEQCKKYGEINEQETKDYAELKAENEQYKKVINKLAGKTVAITTYDTPIEFCDHKDITIQQLKAQLLDQEAETLKAGGVIHKLEKTLTEIKEIVRKNYKTEEELFKIRHSRLPKFSMGALNGRHNLASEILEKISEVLDE